jgi:hypothetical protein
MNGRRSLNSTLDSIYFFRATHRSTARRGEPAGHPATPSRVLKVGACRALASTAHNEKTNMVAISEATPREKNVLLVHGRMSPYKGERQMEPDPAMGDSVSGKW